MPATRYLPLACGLLALGGCAASVSPVVAVPGPNKDAATFQKDEAECRTSAEQAASAPGAPVLSTAKWNLYFASLTQCAAAHGDAVQPVPWTAADVGYGPAYGGYGYGDPYGYGAGYGYGYGYPFAYGYPFFPGFGFGFGYGVYGFGFRGGYGGFRGGYGGFRGGYGGGGFHGGGGFGFHH